MPPSYVTFYADSFEQKFFLKNHKFSPKIGFFWKKDEFHHGAGWGMAVTMLIRKRIFFSIRIALWDNAALYEKSLERGMTTPNMSDFLKKWIFKIKLLESGHMESREVI